MKKFYTLFIAFFMLALAGELRASHAAGATLTYVCNANGSYTFTLRAYRDACGITISGTQTVNFTNNCGLANPSLALTLVTPETNVTPLCAAFSSNTCCGGGALSCFTEIVYQGTVTLGPCANWTASWSLNARNDQIVNIQSPGSQSLYVETVLNTAAFPCNNSVQFNSIPIAYACINQPFVYNPIGTDADGDSLVYSLVTPRSGASNNIPFVAPYSAASPMSSTPPLTIGLNTGIINFTSTVAGNFVVAIRVDEYRNGVLVGSTYRDIQIQVLPANLCMGTSLPPSSTGNAATGGASTFTVNGGTFYVCAGSVLTFNTTYTDPNANESLTITNNVAAQIPGATFTTSGTNPVNATFTWNTVGQTPGTRTFFVTVSDGACPVPNTIVYTYTVEMAQLGIAGSMNQICLHNSNTITLNADGLGGASAPGTYQWSPSVGLNTTTGSTVIANISQPQTYICTYTYTIGANVVCTQTATFPIVASPYSLTIPDMTDQSLCGGTSSAQLNANMPVLPPFVFTDNLPPTTINIPVAPATSLVNDFPFTVTGVMPTTVVNGLINSVCLNISQPFNSHINIFLIAPSGQQIELSSGNGGFGSNGYTNCCFNTNPAATPISNYPVTNIPANGVFKPEGSWNNLLGATVNGTWIIRVVHTITTGGGGTTGTFNGVTLTLNNLNNAVYNWTPPTGLSSTTIQNPVATPSLTTTYQLIANNAYGCRDTSEVTVFVQNGLPTPQVTCGATNLTGVTFDWQPVPGIANYTVSINGGTAQNVGTNTSYTQAGTQGQTFTISVIAVPAAGSLCGPSPAGTQTCTVAACPTVIPTIGGDLDICPGTQTILSLNNAYSGYLWSNGSTTSTVSVGPGTHRVTITESTGCTGTATATVISTTPTVSITGTAAVCTGGSSILTATAGFTGYSWQNGATTQSITVTLPSTYYVTVLNSNGCTATASFVFTINPNPTVNIAGSTSICNGASTLLDAGAHTAYLWNTAATSQTITASSAGTYSVTATDAQGCTGSNSVTVTLSSNLSPTIAAGGSTSFCQGGSVSLNAGTFGSYNWGGGITSQTITANQSGTYSVTVANANGCTGTDAITVTVFSNPSLDLGATQSICMGSTTALSPVVTSGTAPYTYNWGGGLPNGTIQNVSPIVNTTYTLTVNDTNGCTTSDNVTVNVNANPVPNAGQDRTLCNGASTVLNVTTTGGTTPLTYTWDNALNPVQSQSITPSGTQTYNVTVSDANGCSGTDNVVVTVNPVLNLSAGQDVSICTNGTATLTADILGGTMPYNIQWSNGQTTASITVTPAATTTYTVNVTDANNCTVSDNVLVNVSTQLLVNIQPNGSVNFCDGGSVDLNAGLFANYAWSTGSTTAIITASSTGTYSVSVSDTQGCTGTGSITVTEYPNPSVNAGNDITICAGTSTTLTPTGTSGTAPYNFAWSNGQSGNITVSPGGSGTFSVTVTDVHSCTATDDVLVNVNSNPQPDLGPNSSICLNAVFPVTANTNGGTLPYTYTWSNGANSQVINPIIISDTTFTVIVSDAFGCTGTDAITIDTFSTIQFNILTNTGLTQFCNNGNLSLDAGSGFFSYIWSGGQTTQIITVDVGGTYNVTVTDASVCQGVSSITVNELNPIAAQANIINVGCRGGNDGSINVAGLVTGGTGIYNTYQWNVAQTGPMITGLTAGNYTVTVYDSQGCTGIVSFVVNEPATAVGVLADPEDATCYGVANGIAIANPFGGTGPYTFNWSSGAATQTANGLAPSITYIVTVTDSRGCQDTAHVYIDQPAELVVNTVSIIPATCYNTATGIATVIASSGTPPYAYQWSNGATTPTANNLPAGTATVIVSDANGCLQVENIVIPEPAPVVPIIGTVTPPDCSGTNTGHATVSGSGGTPPYSYLWDAGAGSQQLGTATGLASGSYTITVTDFQGCTGTKVVVVPTGTDLEIEIHQTAQIICNGDATAALQVTAVGGVPAYTYLWSNGDTNALADSLTAGNYTVVVTDSHGCTISISDIITEPAPLTATLTADTLTCYDSGDGQIAVVATGGRIPYTYNIDGGSFQSGSNFPGLEPGMHHIITHDFNGCEYLDSIEVIAPDTFTAVITPIDTTLEFGDTYGIEVTVNPQGNITYIWTPHATLSCVDCPDPTVNVTTSNVYTVLVRDENGCEITLQSALSATFPRRVYVANLFSPNNDGKNDVFLVQGGRGVKQVKVFRVYDRWGEMVHEALDVAPNDLAGGWNGTFRGKDMSGAVFTWYAEVLYDDGKTEFIKGDVTLVR